jgi:hypothetical protein
MDDKKKIKIKEENTFTLHSLFEISGPVIVV